MPLLDNKQFSKITQKYCCDSKVFGDVRKHILRDYCLTDYKQSGRCLIMISNKSGRRFFLHKKYRFFDLNFPFWGVPEDLATGRRSFLHLVNESAEEISFNKFKRRAVTQAEDEVLREAMEIINPIYKTEYNG